MLRSLNAIAVDVRHPEVDDAIGSVFDIRENLRAVLRGAARPSIVALNLPTERPNPGAPQA